MTISKNLLAIKQGNRKLMAIMAVIFVVFILGWNNKMDGDQGDNIAKVLIVSILAFSGANAYEHYSKAKSAGVING